MPIAILQVSLIVARLKDQVPAFKAIDGAAELENAIKGRIRITPAGFVVPLKEDAGVNTSGSMVITQEITDRFAVAYAVKDVGNPTGESVLDADLHILRLATLNALVGWAPGAGFNVCEFDGGSLIRIESGVVLWRDRFRTTHINES